jgi:hypothetical protein
MNPLIESQPRRGWWRKLPLRAEIGCLTVVVGLVGLLVPFVRQARMAAMRTADK